MGSIVSNEAFISFWDTSNTSVGSSTGLQAMLPLTSSGTYNFNVDWGDGSNNTITIWNDPAVTHTYGSPGQYTIVITGVCIGWQYANTGDKLKILNISNWGSLNFGTGNSFFSGCNNLTVTATDVINLDGVTSFSSIFSACSSLTTIPNLGAWDVSNITTMLLAFANCTLFNEQSISAWQPTSCTSIIGIFSSCTSFNAPIGNWPTFSIVTMGGALQGCTSFNQPLNWNCAACIGLNGLLSGCTLFNSALNLTNTGNVTDMSVMVGNCVSFNQSVASLDTSSCQNFTSMFATTSFNQSLATFDTSSATQTGFMFSNNTLFNQDISHFDMSHVTNCVGMFNNASSFNQPIGNWVMVSVGPASSMFNGATSFNQNIGTWTVSSFLSVNNFLTGVTLSNANYNLLLNGWSLQTVHPNLIFSGGNSHYDITSGGVNGVAARLVLTLAPNSWTITDGGTP